MGMEWKRESIKLFSNPTKVCYIVFVLKQCNWNFCWCIHKPQYCNPLRFFFDCITAVGITNKQNASNCTNIGWNIFYLESWLFEYLFVFFDYILCGCKCLTLSFHSFVVPIACAVWPVTTRPNRKTIVSPYGRQNNYTRWETVQYCVSLVMTKVYMHLVYVAQWLIVNIDTTTK